jgi:hypothetical protein
MGGPDGLPLSRRNTLSKEQGTPQVSSEVETDYNGTLSFIRADQDLNTFIADLRQNKEQLLSFSRNLMAGKIRSSNTEEGAKDNIALGVYIDLVLRSVLNPETSEFWLFSNNPADYPDEDSSEPLTEAERKEILVQWASVRVASKWLGGILTPGQQRRYRSRAPMQPLVVTAPFLRKYGR